MKLVYKCINLHFTDFCNFKCKHCFVNKENYELSKDQLKYVVDRIEEYFKEYNIKGRINIAGGEPLISHNIDYLIEYIGSKNIEISLITNGYYLDEEFIAKYKKYIRMIGISVDSLDYNTNIKIGRCFKNNVLDKDKLISISKTIKDNGIKLKINTCVNKLNIKEDFNGFINIVKPDRYKIFQMCNSYDKEFNIQYMVDDEEIKEFLSNIKYDYVYESNIDMKESYLIIDSLGNISTNNSHIGNVSIFENTLEEGINRMNINSENYKKRYIEKEYN